MVITYILKNNAHLYTTKRTLSLVCKNWYRYIKEDPTIYNHICHILDRTYTIARTIKNSLSIDQTIACHINNKKEWKRQIRTLEYDPDILLEEINYKNIKSKLLKEDLRVDDYIHHIIACAYFIEAIILLQPFLLKTSYSSENFTSDSSDTSNYLEKLLQKACTNNFYLQSLKKFIDENNFDNKHLRFLLPLKSLIKKNDLLISRLKIEPDYTKTSIACNIKTNFIAIITKIKFLIKYIANVLIDILRVYLC
jgi:hypothetical protein